MSAVRRQQRYILIKIFALLSIVRWLNILLTIFAQYLAAVFVLNPDKSYGEILSNPKLHVLTLASALIIASGYIINSFYDLEKDLVNRPDRTLFGRVVSRNFCLNCYFLFNTLGLLIALIASWRIFLFYFLFASALWAYSHKFQKIPVVREISASLLSVTSFFSIGIFYRYITWPLFVYGCFAMLIIFSREILKSIETDKGNTIFGYGTIVTWLGRKKSAFMMMLVNTVAVLPVIWLYDHIRLKHLSSFLFLVTLVLTAWIWIKIYRKNDPVSVSRIHVMYKIVLVAIIILVVLIHS